MRCVGGPVDGEVVDWTADVVVADAWGEMAYHRTRPTDTDWRDRFDPDWFIKGLPEPVLPERVYEWHERDWEPPEVAAIKGMVRGAARRFQVP